MTSDAPQPNPLPALDLPIRVLRDEGRLELRRGDLFVGPAGPADRRPRVVGWRVEEGLMRDEMILVFGRPLDWTGPLCEEEPGLPLVEHGLGGPFVLTRRRPVARSIVPPPTLFPDPAQRVGWCFGAVLLRGEDNPWYAQSRLTLHRVGSGAG